MTEQTYSFQAEVSRILDIVVNSLYSNHEIFLRELISNASDACDKLRYQALTQPDLLDGAGDFAIRLSTDKDAKTLTVADNGIGMNHDDLIAKLGTIASSGTAEFLAGLSGDAKNDVSMIGQFGVGFYSAFMVAETVEVLTAKAGETVGWRWVSDGKGEFTIDEVPDAPRGTRVTLTLRDDQTEYLEPERLRHVVKTYSDHIALPVILEGGDGDGADETLNAASALWTRPKSEITDEQYKEFYHHHAHAFDEPWATLHYRAEGAIEYTALLFVPGAKPHDLFHPDRKLGTKLYVNRVFITDDAEGLLPAWLRFVRGVVDSPDLPLNVSREMLQLNPVLAKINKGVTSKVLSELGKRAKDDADGYAAFWENFGPVLKEGLYEDPGRRDELLGLCRFRTTGRDGWASLDEVAAAMKEGQEALYYITGDDPLTLARSPQLEAFKAKGVEVLLLTDPIDEFWTGMIAEAAGKPLKPATAAGEDLDKIDGGETDKDEATAEDAGAVDALAAKLKEALGDEVADVRTTKRLTDSAVCLVGVDGGVSLHLERLLKAHGQEGPALPRILEINPGHALIKALAAKAEAGAADDELVEAGRLLVDQARLVEGETLPDPVGFAQRMTRMMERGLG